VILLIVGLVLDGVAVLSGLAQAGLLADVQRGAVISAERAAANDSRQQFVGVVQLIALVLTGVYFLRWNSRVYRNLPALSTRKPSFTPGWAVGSWFVPFLNLVRPFQILRETWWVSSSPQAANDASPTFKPTAPDVLGWWWGIWLVSGFLGNIVLRTAMRGESIAELLSATYLTVFSDLVGILSALLAIQVVKRISIVQDAAYQQPCVVAMGGIGV